MFESFWVHITWNAYTFFVHDKYTYDILTRIFKCYKMDIKIKFE